MTIVRNTIEYLRTCQRARAAGMPVSYTTDPAWLVHMAIDRRAGWVEERHHHGAAKPNHHGEYPKRASGDYTRHLRQLADRINRPRLIVRTAELGEHRWLVQRLPHRFQQKEGEER